jgi:hypothetical protein
MHSDPLIALGLKEHSAAPRPSSQQRPTSLQEDRRGLPSYYAQTRILVAVLSGGSNETLQRLKKYKHVNFGASAERAANREAIVATWGSQADLTLFATAEPLPRGAHRLTLSNELENSGREGLPRKVQAMWTAIARRDDVANFDWFIKVPCDSCNSGVALLLGEIRGGRFNPFSAWPRRNTPLSLGSTSQPPLPAGGR